MSVNKIKSKMNKAETEIVKNKVLLKKMKTELRNHIAAIAETSGLIDLDISDETLKSEFAEIVKKYKTDDAQIVKMPKTKKAA